MAQFQTKFITKEELPLVIEPKNSKLSFPEFLEFIKEQREYIQEKLLVYGGILFRGYPVENADHFNLVVEALNLGKPVSYIGGDTPRDKVKDKVYTSTEAPPSLKILLHNEMSFVKNHPNHVYFFCQVQPEVGGETTIADARRIYEAVDPEVRRRFDEKGLKYITNFYGQDKLLDLVNRYRRAHKTWMQAFETDDPREAEKRCVENDFEYKWLRNMNWMQVIYNRPATMKHPKTQEKVWFNQAHLFDYNRRNIGFFNWLGSKLLYARKDTVMHEIYFGDKQKVERKDLNHVMDVLEEKTIKFPWRQGDVLVLDNILAMHGRAPFSGKRRILAALTR